MEEDKTVKAPESTQSTESTQQGGEIVQKYDYPFGSWLWAKKTEMSAPEIILYGKAKAGIGYYRQFEGKHCYQKEDFYRIWKKPLVDPRVPGLKKALKEAGNISRLPQSKQRDMARVACARCIVEGCGWNNIEACFRRQFMEEK